MARHEDIFSPVEIYTDGPLAGQASVRVLLDSETVSLLFKASQELGHSIDRLCELAISEAALNHDMGR